MKRVYYILVLMLLFLTSCNSFVKKNEAETTGSKNALEHEEFFEKQTEKTEKNTYEESISTVVDLSSIIFEEGESIDLPQARLKNVVVSKKIRINSTFDKQTEQFVCLLNDRHAEDSKSFNSYLVVETGAKGLVYDLKTSSYSDQLYACDIDGDNFDEIVLHQTIDFTGGAGQHVSRIFKVQEKEVYEMFNSHLNLSTKTEEIFDTGFKSEFLEGKKLKIYNSITDYSVILDISKKYTNDFFDINGKGMMSASLECDSFYEFKPGDFDGDGVFEFECLQYAYLLTHGDGLGTARSMLKYNEETKKMEVIECAFSCEK